LLLSTDEVGSNATRGEVGERLREGNAEYDQYVPALDGIDGIVILFRELSQFSIDMPELLKLSEMLARPSKLLIPFPGM
jgi:hypothetical protein